MQETEDDIRIPAWVYFWQVTGNTSKPGNYLDQHNQKVHLVICNFFSLKTEFYAWNM